MKTGRLLKVLIACLLAAMKALGRIGDPRAAEALNSILVKGRQENAPKKAHH